jgi:hypothetical protein
MSESYYLSTGFRTLWRHIPEGLLQTKKIKIIALATPETMIYINDQPEVALLTGISGRTKGANHLQVSVVIPSSPVLSNGSDMSVLSMRAKMPIRLLCNHTRR